MNCLKPIYYSLTKYANKVEEKIENLDGLLYKNYYLTFGKYTIIFTAIDSPLPFIRFLEYMHNEHYNDNFNFVWNIFNEWGFLEQLFDDCGVYEDTVLAYRILNPDKSFESFVNEIHEKYPNVVTFRRLEDLWHEAKL